MNKEILALSLLLIFFFWIPPINSEDKQSIQYHYELLSPIESEITNLKLKEVEAHYIFNSIQEKLNEVIVSITPPEESDTTVIGKALFYPNPFRLETGAQLGFKLSKSTDIEIRIYDLRLQEIYKEEHSFTSSKQYKKISFNRASFETDLSAGVYLFLIVKDEKVLSKGKFAIIP